MGNSGSQDDEGAPKDGGSLDGFLYETRAETDAPVEDRPPAESEQQAEAEAPLSEEERRQREEIEREKEEHAESTDGCEMAVLASKTLQEEGEPRGWYEVAGEIKFDSSNGLLYVPFGMVAGDPHGWTRVEVYALDSASSPGSFTKKGTLNLRDIDCSQIERSQDSAPAVALGTSSVYCAVVMRECCTLFATFDDVNYKLQKSVLARSKSVYQLSVLKANGSRPRDLLICSTASYFDEGQRVLAVDIYPAAEPELDKPLARLAVLPVANRSFPFHYLDAHVTHDEELGGEVIVIAGSAVNDYTFLFCSAKGRLLKKVKLPVFSSPYPRFRTTSFLPLRFFDRTSRFVHPIVCYTIEPLPWSGFSLSTWRTQIRLSSFTDAVGTASIRRYPADQVHQLLSYFYSGGSTAFLLVRCWNPGGERHHMALFQVSV